MFRNAYLLAVLLMAMTAPLGCSARHAGDREDSGYYHVACPYCAREGYWAAHDVEENGARARCVDPNCNGVFTISADAPRTALPQTLASNQQGPVNYYAQCPYCGYKGYWPIARVRECGGNASCSQGCGQVFRIRAETSASSGALSGSQFSNVSPYIAENGSYYGEPNKYGIPKTVPVRSYFRKDGTYVQGHYRSPPRRR